MGPAVLSLCVAGAIALVPATAVPLAAGSRDDGITGAGVDPAPCLERHGDVVDDPDWNRFAASRPPAGASATVPHEARPSETYIERAAALCIARAAGLDDGDGPWHARLLHLRGERRVVWIVTRTRRTEGGGGEHRELHVDAVTGEVRRTSSYVTRPR